MEELYIGNFLKSILVMLIVVLFRWKVIAIYTVLVMFLKSSLQVLIKIYSANVSKFHRSIGPFDVKHQNGIKLHVLNKSTLK